MQITFHVERVTEYKPKDAPVKKLILGRTEGENPERIKFSVEKADLKVGQSFRGEAELGKAEPSTDEDGNVLTYEDGSPVILRPIYFKGKLEKLSVSADEAFA